MYIGLIGAPGVGKTTLASGLFWALKSLGKRVEFCPELVKYKVYRGDDFSAFGFEIQNALEQKNFEQVFSKAHHAGELDYVLCEAPLINGHFYSSFYQKNLEHQVLKAIAEENVRNYGTMIKVHHAPEAEYSQVGRKESRAKSLLLEQHIFQVFDEMNHDCRVVDATYRTTISSLLANIGLPAAEIELLRAYL